MKTRILILVLIALTEIIFPQITNKKSISTDMITVQGDSRVAFDCSGILDGRDSDVGHPAARSIYSRDKKFDFYNATYRFDNFNFAFRFIDGVWHDEMISATAQLELIAPLNFIGYNNSYLLSFFGNWGGGNTHWREILIVYLDNNMLKILQNLACGGGHEPIIENNNLIFTDYDYLATDPRCCPSLEVVSTFVWNGQQFILDSQKKGLRKRD